MRRDVTFNEAPGYVEWLIDFLGEDWGRLAVADYRAHPVRAHFRVGCHPLVPGLAAYEDWQAAGQEARQIPDDALEVARHSAHIQALRRSWAVAPVAENEDFLRLRLRSKEEIDGALYEFKVAYHYLYRGCTVDLLSITKRAGFDMLVRSHSEEVEIECKTTKRGAGRKVHQGLFETLVANLLPVLRGTEHIYVLDLLCDDRLEERDLEPLCADISGRLCADLAGRFELLGGGYHLTIQQVGKRETPLTIEEADALVAPFWRETTLRPHMFAAFDSDAYGAPARTISLSILVCRSARSDNVLRPFMAALSKASRQLTGKHPGLVSIHIPERIDWSLIQPESTLSGAVYQAFQRPRLNVVSGVAFSGLPPGISRRAVLEGTIPAIFWPNPNAVHELSTEFRPAGRPSGLGPDA